MNWTDTSQFSDNSLKLGKTGKVKRADWHLRANFFILFYLLAALISGTYSAISSEDHLSWLTVHLLLFGAITNGILTWSEHFVAALLWSRSQGKLQRVQVTLVLNLGIIGVLVGVSTGVKWLILLSTLLVGGLISFYLWGIYESVSQTLNKRYAGLIRYYQGAGFAILIGIVLGTIDVFKSHEDPWHAKLGLAHLHLNLMGWVGLTIIGTLITFWPTILRTPMHSNAVLFGERALPFLVVGVLAVIAASLLGNRSLIALGNLIYLIGLVIALTPAALVIQKRIPDRASSWMVATGVIGFIFLIVIDSILALQSGSAEALFESIEEHSLLIFVVWLFPIFLGSLTYLLPVVLGRGPKVNRELEEVLNFGWKWRILLMPISSVLLLFTGFHKAGFIFAGVALGIFLILAFRTMALARKYSSTSAF